MDYTDYTGQEILANLLHEKNNITRGKLYFHDKDVTFLQYPIDKVDPATRNYPWDFVLPYDEIAEVGKFNVRCIAPLGLSVHTKSGDEYKFVIYGRNKVAGFLSAKIQH